MTDLVNSPNKCHCLSSRCSQCDWNRHRYEPSFDVVSSHCVGNKMSYFIRAMRFRKWWPYKFHIYGRLIDFMQSSRFWMRGERENPVALSIGLIVSVNLFTTPWLELFFTIQNESLCVKGETVWWHYCRLIPFSTATISRRIVCAFFAV